MVRSTPSPDADRHPGTALSEDALYEVLSARRRRETLHRLDEAGDGIELADLAERIALDGGSDGGRGSNSAAIQRIHVSLYHVHVPKLAAVNAVEFDRVERTVSLTGTGRAIVDRLAERAPADD